MGFSETWSPHPERGRPTPSFQVGRAVHRLWLRARSQRVSAVSCAVLPPEEQIVSRRERAISEAGRLVLGLDAAGGGGETSFRKSFI